ncbi:hypothetical protein PCASD_26272, partial [Puccinia coronata f. sp. avenae]
MPGASEWLHSKLKGAKSTVFEACKALAKLHLLHISSRNTGERYTNTFFQEQWDNEQAYHLESNQSTREKQEKELGRLLRLETQLESKWSVESISSTQAIARAQIVSNLLIQITEQREKVGNAMVLLNLTSTEKDELLMIWHAKNEIRQKYLALIEEKEPLTQVCRPGEQTTLGTAGQQKILESMRRRASGLQKVLREYNERVGDFVQEFPERVHPRQIEYAKLMQLEPDDPFWNNGMFTNQSKPWAVDPNNQKGIHHLAALNRGIEEQRRIGWEVRRAMRWAIDRHQQLQRIIDAFHHPTDSPDLNAVLQQPILQLLDGPSRLAAAKALIHAALIKIKNIQMIWNDYCIKLINKNASQPGETDICTAWSNQIGTMRVPLSQIPGDIHFPVDNLEAQNDNQEQADLE